MCAYGRGLDIVGVKAVLYINLLFLGDLANGVTSFK